MEQAGHTRRSESDKAGAEVREDGFSQPCEPTKAASEGAWAAGAGAGGASLTSVGSQAVALTKACGES